LQKKSNPATRVKPKVWRRQYMVNWPFQIRFIAILIIPALISGLVSGILIYQYIQDILNETIFKSHYATGNPWMIIRRPLLEMNTYLFGSAVILATLAIIIVLRYSKKSLKQIEITVKKYMDFGSPQNENTLQTNVISFAPFHEAVCQLNETIKPLRHAEERLEKLALRVKKDMIQAKPFQKEHTANELDQIIESMKRSIFRFRLDNTVKYSGS